MICPCRLNKEYDVKKVGEVIVIVAEREVYPECYLDDCHVIFSQEDALILMKEISNGIYEDWRVFRTCSK